MQMPQQQTGPLPMMQMPQQQTGPLPMMQVPQQQTGPLPMQMPQQQTGPLPMMQPSAMQQSGAVAAFQTPASQSHSQSYGLTGTGSGSNELSYPRYEVGTGPRADSDHGAALGAKPNRKPLIIGAAVAALLLIIVVIGVSVGGGGGDKAADEIAAAGAPGSADVTPPVKIDDGSAITAQPDKPVTPPQVADKGGSDVAPTKQPEVAPTAPGSGSGSGSAAAPVADDTITLAVTSDPPGAEVQLDGKFLGVTPVKLTRKSATGSGRLEVHHKGFQDSVTHIDLGGDVSKVIALKKTETPASAQTQQTPPVQQTAKGGNGKTPATTVVKHGDGNAAKQPAKNCQPRDKINPFDSRPPC
jgi:hypothetical protein